MTIPTKTWLYLCSVLLYSLAVWYHGYHTADSAWTAKDTKRQLVDAKSANQAWAERFTLQGQLATRDAQLAAEQSKAADVRTVEVIKKEVVYRDRIKEVAVRDCVASSGLLQLYDATLGLPSSAE